MKYLPLLAFGLIPTVTLASDVVVTASRYQEPVTDTLAAVTILTEEDIERYQDQDLGSLLNRIAGVSLTTTGSLGSTTSLSIRGTSTSQMIVLIDGVRTASATTGQTTLSSIPLSNIERIEIVRGPVSSIHGADAVGGVVQVFTKTPTEDDSDVYLGADYGSHNYHRLRGGFSMKTDKTQAGADISYTNTDGFDSTTLGGANDDKDGFTQWSGDLTVDTQLTDTLGMGIRHLQTSSDAEYDSECYSGFVIVPCGNHVDFRTLSDLMNSTVSLDYTGFNDTQINSRIGRFVDKSVTEATDSEFQTERYTFSLTGGTRWSSSLRTIVGIDGYTETVDTSADFEETERSNVGLFTQLNADLGAFSTQGSVRVDNNSAYGTNLTGSLTASAFVSDSVEVLTIASTAFRAPSFNELYYPGYGNEDLNPEESRTLEVAIRQYLNQGEWRLSVYQTYIDDLIDSDPDTFKAANINEATLNGIEAEWHQQFNAYGIQLTGTYLDARDGENERLSNRPEWTAFAALDRRQGPVTVTTDLRAETGRISVGEDLDGHALLGLGVRYNLDKRSHLSARVDNLLDQEYIVNNYYLDGEYYNTAGRTFRLSIEYHL